jgi:hypothetical protein
MALEDLCWHEDAIATIIGLAHAQSEFSADDLRRELRPAPHGSHVGAAFTAARRLGYIEAVGHTTSTSKTRHRGTLRTWRHAADKGVTK